MYSLWRRCMLCTSLHHNTSQVHVCISTCAYMCIHVHACTPLEHIGLYLLVVVSRSRPPLWRGRLISARLTTSSKDQNDINSLDLVMKHQIPGMACYLIMCIYRIWPLLHIMGLRVLRCRMGTCTRAYIPLQHVRPITHKGHKGAIRRYRDVYLLITT